MLNEEGRPGKATVKPDPLSRSRGKTALVEALVSALFAQPAQTGPGLSNLH
jgi:hypothetical protein